MTTLVKQSPKKKQLRKGEPPLLRPTPRESRLKQRALYWFKHPLNAAWGWLSSVRTAILLITGITLICLLGIYFVQAPDETLNNPALYISWVQLNELPKYGSLTAVFNWFQFYTIFSSWYFMLLLTLLALSVVVCTLNRLPAIWQNFRHPILRRSDKFYENAVERVAFEREDSIEWTTKALRKRGYRVRTLKETVEVSGMHGEKKAEVEATFIYANKNSWATLSTFAFHAALVTLLLAGAFSQWHGFALTSPARRILPGPLLSLSDAIAGFTYDVPLPAGATSMVYPFGTPNNISFRTNKFTATFDPTTGEATDYVTNLSVYRNGILVAQSNHLRVNDPLSYDGVVFHQSSLIAAVNVTIADGSGCLICNQPITLNNTENVPASGSSPAEEVDLLKDIPIANTNMVLSVYFIHTAKIQMDQISHPSVILTIGKASADIQNIQKGDLLNLQAGQSSTVPQGWKVTLDSASDATVLLVTKDTGSLLIWPTAIILILSLCLTFYFPQRRIWIRIVRQRVQLASLREHFVNLRIDLLALEKASRSGPDPALKHIDMRM
jgi:cytochrome c biogenesis protein